VSSRESPAADLLDHQGHGVAESADELAARRETDHPELIDAAQDRLGHPPRVPGEPREHGRVEGSEVDDGAQGKVGGMMAGAREVTMSGGEERGRAGTLREPDGRPRR
jgi:hypothetical protein